MKFNVAADSVAVNTHAFHVSPVRNVRGLSTAGRPLSLRVTRH